MLSGIVAFDPPHGKLSSGRFSIAGTIACLAASSEGADCRRCDPCAHGTTALRWLTCTFQAGALERTSRIQYETGESLRTTWNGPTQRGPNFECDIRSLSRYSQTQAPIANLRALCSALSRPSQTRTLVSSRCLMRTSSRRMMYDETTSNCLPDACGSSAATSFQETSRTSTGFRWVGV